MKTNAIKEKRNISERRWKKDIYCILAAVFALGTIFAIQHIWSLSLPPQRLISSQTLFFATNSETHICQIHFANQESLAEITVKCDDPSCMISLMDAAGNQLSSLKVSQTSSTVRLRTPSGLTCTLVVSPHSEDCRISISEFIL